MRRRTIALIVVVAVAAMLATVVAWRMRTPSPTSHDHAGGTPTSAGGFTDSVRADVTLDTRRQQLIGVRIVAARRTMLSPEVRAAGTVTFDETRQVEINTRVDGWIRELYADYTGRPIHQGEPLFTLYSPDVISTQNEYLLALKGQTHAGSDASSVHGLEDRLVAAARDRLVRLDMSPGDIDQLRASGRTSETITFRAPANGVIVEKMAVRGMRVMAGQTLYKVADLSTLWVEADIYERDLAAVRTGAAATVSVQAYPERSFTGRVSYISPIVTPDTRTVRTRITLPNRDGLLKPNMVASIVLSGPAADALVVPPDAVVDTGTRRFVFVADGSGRYAPRDVRVGRRTAESTEILSGLTEGELVADSATFFLDSESQLRSALHGYEPPTFDERVGPAAAPAIDVTFRYEPDPPKPGTVTFFVTAKDASGAPVAGVNVRVVLFMAAMPSMNMPALKTEAALLSVSDGVYRGSGEVMTPGRWDVTVTLAKEGRTIAMRQFALMVQ
ncbi:MAG TPA: efflux RND transporter periplasmic adaptor subunit [Vicinamibacterales bacterium]|jgi:Cu(I)/Ag(I) efflux system membrane fusion protein/cobalt-zinc-cadmium efflux system membrane fusion protein